MRFVLGILGFVFVVVMAIVLLAHGGPKTATTPANKTINLMSYTKDNSVQVEYLIDGPINASENHRSIKIVISPVSRTLDVIKGYQGQVITTKTYSNDTNAYGDFLKALDRYGFTDEHILEKGTSSQSVCPVNSRTHYQIVRGSKNLMNLWSAPCTRGSFAGDVNRVKQLFSVQIPDYGQLTKNVEIAGAPTGGIF